MSIEETVHPGPPSPELEKPQQDGIVLIPTPLDDPRDPLNWPFRKKCGMVAVLSIAMFAGYSAPFCGQLNLVQQAKLYHKTTVQITYFNSAASAGLASGGFFYSPLAHKFGRSCVILFALLGCLAAQIWAPKMTKQGDYWSYFGSRFLAGFFGMVTSVLGPKYLVDLFFLHQRGRVFTILHLALNFGASAGPTFSGFIAANRYWPVEYWWSVGLLAFTAILVFCFLEETSFDRSEGAINLTPPESWIANRIQTFFPFLPGSNSVIKPTTLVETAKVAILPFKIALSPVLLTVAGFDTISFGFYVALNALTPVWLQKPKKHGGYGFTITENACFTFVHWIGFIFGLVYGQFVSDRIPLWIAKRHGGVWKPEYRLHALWLTNFFMMPVGLGLVGAALMYKLHWVVFALGQIFVTIGSMVSIPVTVNYIAECFRSHTVEATIPVNSMRLFLGLSINFYATQWIAKTNIGWFYGMMAFFSLFAFFFLILLMWKGHVIRSWTPFSLGSDEEGEHVVADKNIHAA
ncbi:putative MFS-type transporter protein [Lachnellula hyalina]|uniref:Putative MFS-type transporter protein n=1 Tax=Lachnellula hyalina TaxID=1316788 RepID=A0A8H8U196_9HELO|nr:putative MFS-type transporter protein [Lachnellula hyalina]TVY26801.1 putative MFS-type transporter protein [Lachnellula hyalina]